MKVTIFNDNNYPLKELFKGEEVLILAKDFWRDKAGNVRLFDQFEANDFRGQYHPVPMDLSGKMIEDARHHKILKITPVDEIKENKEDDSLYRCMAPSCKHVSPSEEELQAHVKVRHAELPTLEIPDEDARAAAAKKKKVG